MVHLIFLRSKGCGKRSWPMSIGQWHVGLRCGHWFSWQIAEMATVLPSGDAGHFAAPPTVRRVFPSCILNPAVLAVVLAKGSDQSQSVRSRDLGRFVYFCLPLGTNLSCYVNKPGRTCWKRLRDNHGGVFQLSSFLTSQSPAA